MTFNAGFRRMMPWTITYAPATSYDKAGHPNAWGAAVPLQCRIQGPQQFFHQAAGQMSISKQTLYVDTSDGTVIETTGKITLPGGFEQSTPLILSVDRQSDATGLHHTKVYLG